MEIRKVTLDKIRFLVVKCGIVKYRDERKEYRKDHPQRVGVTG